MATILTTTADFIVNLDRAQHMTAERVTALGDVTRGIDFGIFSQEADVLRTWIEMDEPHRNALAPAINAFLTAEFDARA